jgi:heterodisulfide reductase subunit C
MSDKPSSLREYVDGIIEGVLARCTSCGRCYEVCPMSRYSKTLEGAPPREVVAQVLGVLRREPDQTLGLEFTRVCTQSASCIPACPEGINPMLMLRAARMVALGSLGDATQIESREEPQFFRKIDTYAALQLDNRELAEWHDRRLP